MVFEELNVSVGADTADFTAGMNRTEDKLDDVSSEALSTAGSMNILKGRLDSASDEMTETAVKAGAASTGINSLSTSSTAASFSTSGLSTVLVGTLVPALATVAAAAIPVVTALGGIVAIAGSIGAIGLIGALAAMKKNTEELKTAFNSVLSTLGDEFAFAIDMATGVLIDLMATFKDIIPELVPANDIVVELAGLFSMLGESIIRALPALVDFAITITQEFLPGMIRLVNNVLPRVPGFLQTLVQTFRRLIPAFQRATGILVTLAPQLLEFGFAALNVVGPALERLTTILVNGLTAFNNLDNSLKSISLKVATLAPVVLGMAALLGGPLTLAVVGIIGAFVKFREEIIAFGQTWVERYGPQARQLFENIRPIAVGLFNALTNAISQVGPPLGTLLGEFIEFGNVILPLIERFLPAMETQLSGIASVLAGVIQAVTGLVQLFTGDFGEAAESFNNSIDSVAEGLGQIARGQAQALLTAGDTVGDVIESTRSNLGGGPGRQARTAGGARIAGGTQNVQIQLEENTDVVNARIENGAENVVERRERRSDRLANRGG